MLVSHRLLGLLFALFLFSLAAGAGAQDNYPSNPIQSQQKSRILDAAAPPNEPQAGSKRAQSTLTETGVEGRNHG